MTKRVSRGGLQVAVVLADFFEQEALPAVGLAPETFWPGFAEIVGELSRANAQLLSERDRLQSALDDWHSQYPGPIDDMAAYQEFLASIDYLLPQPPAGEIATENVDSEITDQAGPQLVVPVSNARYALNAANARWGSLYDALYGTDAIDELDGRERAGGFNAVRAGAVVDAARQFLDRSVPLAAGSHALARAYRVRAGQLDVELPDGVSGLKDPTLFVGYTGRPEQPESVLLRHHGLHIDIQIDRSHPIGSTDAAGVKDVVLESALTTIMDCEDSVAAVDAEDKTQVYRNWLGLMQGTLVEQVTKQGRQFTRELASDRHYVGVGGQPLILPGRSLMFIRNVGHLMTNPAVLDAAGNEVPEGILDAVATVLCAMPDLKRRANSRAGSVYVVKPKMHGPDEVAFANRLFDRVEKLLGLPSNTVKLGIMDEERRTSVNLMACILAARNRVAFINTGFLDRTGDEMHTAMQAGPMRRKGDMRTSAWIAAYEKGNVLAGLACGLRGRAQIGKGMWAMPDLMAAMLAQKGAQLQAGANTAWVPSPTAATLHATHYHDIDVAAVQAGLQANAQPQAEIDQEVDNNVQGILGYVVRWVDQGVGCSKVPDIHDVGLMEDRATLRISSQHLANWLHHGVIDEAKVRAAFQRMAKVVDEQNVGDPAYVPLTGDTPTTAMQAAQALVFDGLRQPSGYTEPLLHAYRLRLKAAQAG